MTTDHLPDPEQLARDPDLLRELAQLRAKATLADILGEVPDFRWRYDADRVLRNIALLHARLAGSSTNGEDGWQAPASRLIAQAWESLATLSEHVDRPTALLNAAVQYEIAGYQANAACLARSVVRREQWTTTPTLSGITSAFIQRLLIRSHLLADQLASPPTDTIDDDLGLFLRAATSATARALDEAALFHLSGDAGRQAAAMEMLDSVHAALRDSGYVRETNIVRGLLTILPVMERRSIWAVLGDRPDANPRWRRYLRALGRGLGSRVVESRSVSELWPSQIAALEGGLLDGQDAQVLRMPTSAGKTRVAELAIVHQLVTRPGTRALYVAPFRALVSEVTESFSNLFDDLGLAATSVVGTFEEDQAELVVADDAQLLVVTPEKLDLLLRLNSTAFDNVGLVALDEGQLAGDPTRGARYELLVTRLRAQLPEAKFILLSAVVSDQTLADFAQWVGGEDGSVVSTRWRPAIQRAAALEWNGRVGVLRYVAGEGQQGLAQFLPGLIRAKTVEYVHPGTQRTRRTTFPSAQSKSQVAAEVAYELANRGSVLVFCAQANWTRSVGQALLDRIDLARWSGDAIPEPFRAAADREELPPSLAIAAEWLGAESLVARLLSRGIGIHYGRLPDAVRQAIEEDFRARRLRVLIATSTLAQGVNLPVRTVVFHSCWRSDGTSRTRMSAREYWNIAGRAGRAGEETEGTSIHLVVTPSDRSDLDFFISRRNAVEEVRSVLFEQLRDLIAARISPEVVGEALDPEILAILAEEGADDLAGTVDRVLSNSLCGAQARRLGVSLQPIAAAMTDTAEKIARSVPPDLRSTFSTTGLSSSSCAWLLTTARENAEWLTGSLPAVASEHAREVYRLAIETVAGLPEMADAGAYPGDLVDLAFRWIGGTPAGELFGADDEAPDEASSRLEDVLTYLLPWGTSAFLRIAAKALNVDASGTIAGLPAMLKYGVPTIEAAWVQGAGVRSRQASIELARRFRATGLPSTPGQVRTWLRGLDPEDLMADFAVDRRTAFAAVGSVVRSSRNELVDLYEEGRLLPRDVSVRLSRDVIRSGAHQRVAEQTSPILLRRDYLDPINRNAIVVEHAGGHISRLPWLLSQVLALEIDAGSQFQAEFVGLDEAARTLTLRLGPQGGGGPTHVG